MARGGAEGEQDGFRPFGPLVCQCTRPRCMIKDPVRFLLGHTDLWLMVSNLVDGLWLMVDDCKILWLMVSNPFGSVRRVD